MKNVELLAPAGDEQSARAALMSGADAIYLGLTRFSARESAENFDFSALSSLTSYARLLGAKVYVCLNTLVKDSETEAFLSAVRGAWNAGADAILLQDLFLGKRLKEQCPELVLHLSTQAGCCNQRGALLAREFGFSRVVLARETPLAEIRRIAPLIETEVFVQGALCTCFSGQCYLSSFAGNNSGNRGRCKQPCRKRYQIDRKGFEDFAYALSPSDLCVGERIADLIAAGVVSLKIEGRMRRPEYVAAAVNYYRALLVGKKGEAEFSDLARTYNRGGYTRGLAFGQKEDFLSRKVQGHIGERVGAVESGGFVKSDYPARKGDGFKILRNGLEAGGAVFEKSGRNGFFLAANFQLKAGDEVRLTTDSALKERVFGERRRRVRLCLRFVGGERAEVSCGEIKISGDVLQEARSAPLTEEELAACFSKTDGLPLAVEFDSIVTKNAFLPKSALNALRREFFAALLSHCSPARPPLPLSLGSPAPSPCSNHRVAVLAADFTGLKADILIYKPADYRNIDPDKIAKGEGKKYLYLPPFWTSEDEETILPVLPYFDGLYSDGFYALSLAKERGMSFFAGTGFNLTNRFSVEAVKRAGASEIALSKELTGEEQRALAGEGIFALTLGSLKVMDLAYCPFGRTCGGCDKRARYTLTDEENRAFPLRRYRTAGGCRFELYNCLPLAAYNGMTGALIDLTSDKVPLSHAFTPEEAGLSATKGHFSRSLL